MMTHKLEAFANSNGGVTLVSTKALCHEGEARNVSSFYQA